MDEFIDCKLNAKITLEQCEHRQLSHPRHRGKGEGTFNSMFLTCMTCQHWIPDSVWGKLRRKGARFSWQKFPNEKRRRMIWKRDSLSIRDHSQQDQT